MELMCPLCRMDQLKIKKAKGAEWLLSFLTGKRKYYCVSCGHFFRAPDRRKTRRPTTANAPNRIAKVFEPVGERSIPR